MMEFVNKVNLLFVFAMSLQENVTFAAMESDKNSGELDQNYNSNVDLGDIISVNKKDRKPTDRELNQKYAAVCSDLLTRSTFLTPSRSSNINSFSTPDIMYMNSLGKTDLARFNKAWSRIKMTPNRSKEAILRSITMKNRKYITRDKGDDVVQNNKLIDAYEKKSPAIKFISENESLFSDEMIPGVSAVNVSHVMNAKIERDGNGEFMKITGGHAQKCYRIQNIRLWDSKGFVGSDENVMAISFSGKIGKTVNKRTSPEKIVSNVLQGRVIARSSDNMNVSLTAQGKFVGSYSSKDNSFFSKTQFPILVVSDANLDSSRNILVGSFVKFQRSGVIKHKSKKPFLINQSQFDGMMDDSNLAAFSQIDQEFVVKDLTEALQLSYAAKLRKNGMKKFPTPIYGIKKIK